MRIKSIPSGLCDGAVEILQENVMNILRNLCLASALLALPGLAYADTKPAAGMNCPMMGDTLQKGMGGMMTDMSAMMKDIGDPVMKARMQKMHEQMAAMMTSMQGMHGGTMMGGGGMQAKPREAAPPAAPDDHAAHHPK